MWCTSSGTQPTESTTTTSSTTLSPPASRLAWAHAPAGDGPWYSCVAPATARSGPPRPQRRRASPRPTTCWTGSRATSTSTGVAAAPGGKPSACPGSSHEHPKTIASEERARTGASGSRGMSSDVPSVRIPAQLPDGVSQATIGVRGGLLRSGLGETAEAMYLTSGDVYAPASDAEKAFTGEIDRYVYSRYGNPTITMFEERLRLIEGAPAAFATVHGVAAVFTSLGALLGAGDRLVAARSLFGSCFVVCGEILPRWGVETVFVDGEDLSQWEEALSVPTQAVFFETPSNPMQSLVDIG